MKLGIVFSLGWLVSGFGGHVRAEEKSGLVVHEWGVLMRKNTFPETVGAAEEWLASLPGFVGMHSGYKPEPTFRPWTKPVLHFYGKEQEVSVEILTPTGKPVAYWPTPMLLEDTFWEMGTGLKDSVGMRWEGTLSKDRPEGGSKVKRVAADHWWEKIRGVEGLWLEMAEGAERFLFYEGTGRTEPTVVASIEGDRMILENRDTEVSGSILVILNSDGQRNLAEVGAVAAGGRVVLKKEEVMGKAVTRDVLREAARRQWESFGMTVEEAAMIVSVWEDDLWENKGFLVVSRMAPQIYDRYIFPIEIEPVPDELVRAAVVFDTLPGVEGRLGWLPELEKEMEKFFAGLGSEDAAERERATSGLAAYGDLARDVLKELIEAEDLESRMRAQRLLGFLERKPAVNLPMHLGRGSVADPKISNDMRQGAIVVLEGEVKERAGRGIFLIHPVYGDVKLEGVDRSAADGGGVKKWRGRFRPAINAVHRHAAVEVEQGEEWVFQVGE